MSAEIAKYEMIDLYLEEKLGPEEMIAFRYKMQSDPALAAEVEAQKMANDLIIGSRLSKVKEMMDSDFKAGKVKRGGKGLRWLIGGAMLLAALGVLVTVKTSETPSEKSTKSFEVFSTGRSESGAEENEPSRSSGEKQVASSKEQQEKTSSGSAGEMFADKEDLALSSQEDSGVAENPLTNPVKESFPPTEAMKREALPVVQKEAGCATRSADVSFSTSSTCKGKDEGRVIVDKADVKNGKSPYRFALIRRGEGTLHEGIHFQKSMIFDHYPSGHYVLWVEDAEGCRMAVNKEVDIKVVDCHQSYSFAPAYNEVFHFPVDETTEGTMVIKDKGGNTVYATEIKGGQPSQWDGSNLQGGICSPGIYIYILEYRNGRKVPGQVVVY